MVVNDCDYVITSRITYEVRIHVVIEMYRYAQSINSITLLNFIARIFFYRVRACTEFIMNFRIKNLFGVSDVFITLLFIHKNFNTARNTLQTKLYRFILSHKERLIDNALKTLLIARFLCKL